MLKFITRFVSLDICQAVVIDFQTFCPKMLAGLSRLPDTIKDRSLDIRTKRKLREERVERFRFRKVKHEADQEW